MRISSVWIAVAALCAGLSLAACSDSLSVVGSVDELVGVSWTLVAVHTEQGTVTPAGTPRRIPAVEFTGEPARGILAGDRLEGTGGCNVVFGAYRAEGTGALTVTELAWTEMACFPSEVMSVEQVFFQSLGLARSFRVDDTGLEISFEGGTIELVAADG